MTASCSFNCSFLETPDEEVSLPSVEVDTQAPGAKLEGDLSLRDKEVAARDIPGPSLGWTSLSHHPGTGRQAGTQAPGTMEPPGGEAEELGAP